MTGFAKNSAASIRNKTIQWWWCSLQAPLSPPEKMKISIKKEVRQPQEKIKRKKLENLLQT